MASTLILRVASGLDATTRLVGSGKELVNFCWRGSRS